MQGGAEGGAEGDAEGVWKGLTKEVRRELLREMCRETWRKRCVEGAGRRLRVGDRACVCACVREGGMGGGRCDLTCASEMVMAIGSLPRAAAIMCYSASQLRYDSTVYIWITLLLYYWTGV